MSLYFPSIALAVIANVTYHLCSKKMHPQVNPMFALVFTYLTALLIALVCLPLFGWRGGFGAQISRINWTSFALGLSVIGLELGYIFAYRSGWQLNMASIYANVAVGILLVPVGYLLFSEGLSATHILGLCLATAGLVLLSR